MKKPGMGRSLPAFEFVDCCEAALVPLELIDFLIESAFERGMFLFERLDAILQRHARSS